MRNPDEPPAKRGKNLLVAGGLALFLLALWVSVGRPRDGRSLRGTALSPFVRVVGHRTPVAWGVRCGECHPPRVIGAPRPAVTSASVHRTIMRSR